MQHTTLLALLAVTAALMSSCTTQNHAQTAETSGFDTLATTGYESDTAIPGPANANWPVIFTEGGASYTLFEPQCDSWDGREMAGRCAVAVQPAGQTRPFYGVISFNAITLVNKASHSATLAEFKLVSADFPSAREQAKYYLAPIIIQYSKSAPPLALNHLEQSLALPEPPRSEHLNNSPPKILIATRPAVLVSIDGPPAWRSVPGTGLERAINSRMLLLKDPTGLCYLHLFDGYLQAASLDGPWKVASAPPAGAAIAETRAVDAGQVDLMPGAADETTGKPPSLRSASVPDVFVSTTPAEMIQFGGPPEFAAIPGTDLLYAVNTSGNAFKLLTDQENYILIAGRWYRAPSWNGPWRFVPGNRLPHDFANIPDNNPKENVKASVPGTPQAEEALIANSIPQGGAIPRNSTLPAPRFDGAVQLAPIAGTPLDYAVNSAIPIIRLDSQSWYACQDGVWYDSTSCNGPWTVATSVPSVIYTIPPNSPLHYLTFVQVYGATPDQVYEGYTPGYLGTEVGDDGTVVYGTGYDYNPWLGAEWYCPPITWGCGFDDCWTPWWGWGFDCGFGWGWGLRCYPPNPWWGGYCGYGNHWDRDHEWGRNGLANTGADLYRHRRQFAENGVNAARRPDNFSGYAHAYNSRTGQITAGQTARFQHVPISSGAIFPTGASSGNRFSAFQQNGPAGGYRWNAGFRAAGTPGSRGWSAPNRTWFNQDLQNRIFYSPRSAGMNRGAFYGGERAGNNVAPATRGGGWFHSSGGFHGRGGGGFHGGGGRGGGGGHGH